MKKGRIICVGNLLLTADAAGMLVLHELRSRPLEAEVEIVAGGLSGLDLLPWFENCRRVVLVDRILGFGPPGAVLHLDLASILDECREEYSHSGGLLYLLHALPYLGLNPMPTVCLIGIEGPGDPLSVRRAADLALEAVHAQL